MRDDYQKLVSFVKRISLNHRNEESNDQVQNEAKQNLVPKLIAPTDTCTLELPSGVAIELPILNGTVGPQSIDGRGFHEKTGIYTYDPGFTSTASCVSAITYIDGDIGQLWYRGYSID